MSDEIRILYNDTCPVCRFEIDGYRRLAERGALPLRFDRLDEAAAWGLTPDAAARRLHVVEDGRLLSGMAAFRAIWARLPHLAWAARVTGWPVIRQGMEFAYDRIAAPVLYRAHLRRQARKGR
ncbi:thiol-disulfide oxidoreductase DCC family protein [Paragemmobacter straminiformis]|uniref:DUF393 domain-containing protein n=1 Tax=Paragemmobacter straminiformis TaxID=2045119 RepID=A0A842I5U8_9RHOB|nr:DUF393 domain-containing protein [Gemmobacter straminiformis]MBC2834444.1 DUF393 domain-containing protein [Gemmobacter straminiformis]